MYWKYRKYAELTHSMFDVYENETSENEVVVFWMLYLCKAYIEHVIMWVLFIFNFVYIWLYLYIIYDMIMWKTWTKFKNFWDVFFIEFQISLSCNSCIFKRKKILNCLCETDMYYMHDIKQFDHVILCVTYVLYKYVTFFFFTSIFSSLSSIFWKTLTYFHHIQNIHLLSR